MLNVEDVSNCLERFAPTSLAEDWDNVGLLVGERGAPVERIMTCLTITPDSADEAIGRGAQLIVAHHPLPFRPLKRLTDDSVEGQMLLKLIAAGVAIYSPHTAFDSATLGVNQRLAEGLQLEKISPLIESVTDPALPGSGRFGRLAAPLGVTEFANQVKRFLKVDQLQLVASDRQEVHTVAVACGSGGEFLAAAQAQGCDCLVTGESRFHTCLQAEATGMALILPGHFASERFAVESLADYLAGQFSAAEVWASAREQDPLRWQ